MSDAYRALVCITTSRRLQWIRRTLPHFAAYCRRDSRFSLLLTLDGDDEAYHRFCDRWRVPLVHSERQEGVGLAKNRVLQRFPDFDHYFFLEDDVELADGAVFPAHVELARSSGIHHFSLFRRGGLREPTGETRVGDVTVRHGMFGGAPFNYFTREGLSRVGGWHPRFAEYRRWGHTEHSYRFPRAGLAPAPFNVAEEFSDMLIWHFPPSVTGRSDVPVGADGLSEQERELMELEIERVPVQTLSPHHFNGVAFDELGPLAATLDEGERYPLLDEDERGRARADFLVWSSGRTKSPLRRAGRLLRAGLLWPGSPMLRETVKRILTGKE